jgi:hypothetical protein
MLTIEYKNPKSARKLKWKLKGTKSEMDALREMFGEPDEVKPRNTWGPKGMPADIRRERLIRELADVESRMGETG